MIAALHHILAEGKFPTSPWLLLVGFALVIGSLMWSGFRRKRRNLPENRIHLHAEQHNHRLEVQARNDINELMVRLEEVSREICGKIDTRFAKLEHVIAEADQKLAALAAAAREGGSSAEPPSEVEPPAAPLDPRHAEIARRSAAGQDNIAIAREMGMQPGEVELIISLERNRLRQA